MLQSHGDAHTSNPFSQRIVTITKAEHIDLIHSTNYWKALHAQLKEKCTRLEEESQRKDARIRDLNNRVFGKKSEKQNTATPEKSESSTTKRSRGQQRGSRGMAAFIGRPMCVTRAANAPAVSTASPPPRLIPRSPYGISFWVEALLSKLQSSQPTHRHLQDLNDRSLPVSPGTVAGGLQTITPLFKPIMECVFRRR